MKHQRGLDRNQSLLFPERLEDYVGGELRETDASGGGKNAAKRLKGAAAPFFPFVDLLSSPSAVRTGPGSGNEKTGDPNFRTASQSFFAHSARLFTRPRDLLDHRVNFINQYWQFSPLPVQLFGAHSNTMRTHMLIKSLGVWVGFNLQRSTS